MKKYLFAGLITLLPAALTVIIVIWVFDLLTEPFIEGGRFILFHVNPEINIVLQQHEDLTKFVSRVLVLIALFIVTLLLGFLGRRYFFTPFLRTINAAFSRIPLVKVIYSLTKDLSKSMFASDQKPFKETALVPFPQENSHAIGFVTGDVPPLLKKHIPEIDLIVFVPTAPHPVCGFILLCPQNIVKPIDVSTEDAFKFIISCGASHFPPTQNIPPPKP